MPVFTIQAPDGTHYDIDAADEATAIHGAQQTYAQDQALAGMRSTSAAVVNHPGAAFTGARASNTPPPRVVGPREDVLRAAPSGLIQGLVPVANVAGATRGASGDAMALGGFLVRKAGESLGLINRGQSQRIAAANAQFRGLINAPTSAETMASPGVHAVDGDYHATTMPGRITQTAASLASGALFPGSGAARVAAVAVPTVVSEGAGDAAEMMGASPNQVAIVRAAGAAGGGLIAGAAPRVGGLISRVAGRGADVTAGMQEAEAALIRAGVRPAELPAGAGVEIQHLIEQGARPEAAVHHVLAQTLPERVPITRGQASGLPGEQAVENSALRGSEGHVAASVMRGTQDEAHTALRANAGAVADTIAGGAAPTPLDAGVAVSDRLNTMRNSAESGVNAAYTAARDAGEGAHLPAAERPVIAAQIREAVRDYDPVTVAPVTRELERLDGLSTVTARDMFESRTRLGLLRQSNDPVVAGAAGKAVRSLDSYIDNAVTKSLFTGDPNAVASWRAAIGQRRAFGQLFEGDDLIENLTARESRGGRVGLSVAPEDAANYILGRSALGFVGRRNLIRDMTRLRDVLGATSDEWNGLRSATFQRFVQAGEGPMAGADRAFSGQKFASAWRDANARDPRMMALLFTADERATINRLAAVSQRVTSPVAGGFNTSNTATVARILKAASAPLRRIPIIGHVIEGIEDAMKGAHIRSMAVNPTPSRGGPRLALPSYDVRLAAPGLIGSVTGGASGLLPSR